MLIKILNELTDKIIYRYKTEDKTLIEIINDEVTKAKEKCSEEDCNL